MGVNTGPARGKKLVYATREENMLAFDQLPPLLRHTLANARYDWSPVSILKAYKKSRNAAAILEEIRTRESKMAIDWEGRA